MYRHTSSRGQSRGLVLAVATCLCTLPMRCSPFRRLGYPLTMCSINLLLGAVKYISTHARTRWKPREVLMEATTAARPQAAAPRRQWTSRLLSFVMAGLSSPRRKRPRRRGSDARFKSGRTRWSKYSHLNRRVRSWLNNKRPHLARPVVSCS